MKIKKLEEQLLNYMKQALIEKELDRNHMYFNFHYDEAWNTKGNDLIEFLEKKPYEINDVLIALDNLEEQCLIRKEGVMHAYGTIFLTELAFI